jgi:hypothetical protein
VCIVVHTLLAVYEDLVRLSDFLPAGWSAGVVRQVLGAMLEGEALV